MMSEMQRRLERTGMLYSQCGQYGCDGVLMPFDDTVLCTEGIKVEMHGHEEGGSD